MGRGKRHQNDSVVEDTAIASFLKMDRGKRYLKDCVDEETASTCSTSASSSDLAASLKIEEEHDEESLLEVFVEKLYEKRASTREAALKGLINAFAVSILEEYAEQQWETLSYLYITSIKRGSTETALAARALGLLIVTLGSGDAAHNIFAEAYPHLVKVAKLGSDSVLRVAAVESLEILAFVSQVEDDAIEKAMELLWQIGTYPGGQYSSETLGVVKPSSELQAAAISSWAVLLSAGPVHPGNFNKLVETSVSSLCALLDTGSLEIQRAAGEAIALIFELYYSNKIIEGYSEKISDSYAKTDMSMKEREDQLLEQMKSLCFGARGKGHSKKEMSSQRSSFRSLVTSIEEGVCPETLIRFRRGDTLKIDTWSRTLPLNAFRKLLATGFQIHMQYNHLLHQIFEFTPLNEKQKVLTAKEKRLFLSPNSVTSKWRTQVRNYNRSMAQAENRDYYTFSESDGAD